MHFTKIWEGNGFSHMNIYIVTALIDALTLQPGDEVGIFDGNKCVGTTIVDENYAHKDYLVCDVITSMDDGTGNGFTPGNTIDIRVWQLERNKEVDTITVKYHNDIDFWTTDGTFNQNGSAFVDLIGINIYQRNFSLHAGSNQLSLGLDLSSLSVADIFDVLIQSGQLIKVQNEKGQAFEKFTENNWLDFIGSIEKEEIITIVVSEDCELEISGTL